MIQKIIYKTFSIISHSFLIEKIYGNIPNNGPIIIASNHASYLDPIIIPVVIYKASNNKIITHYLAKKELFKNPFMKFFQNSVGSIMIDRNDGKQGLKKASEMLQSKNIIGIFPEGTRKKDDNLGVGKSGVARLAIENSVDIIPCALDNTFSMMPRKKIIPKFGKKTNVIFGEKISVKNFSNTKQDIKKLTVLVMENIKDLLSESRYGKKNYKLK